MRLKRAGSRRKSVELVIARNASRSRSSRPQSPHRVRRELRQKRSVHRCRPCRIQHGHKRVLPAGIVRLHRARSCVEVVLLAPVTYARPAESTAMPAVFVWPSQVAVQEIPVE